MAELREMYEDAERELKETREELENEVAAAEADAKDADTERGEAIAEAAIALSAYLVSLGLAANPLRAPDNEHLARLTELLL